MFSILTAYERNEDQVKISNNLIDKIIVSKVYLIGNSKYSKNCFQSKYL